MGQIHSKQSVKLLLAKGKADTDVNGKSEISFKVPTDGRSIEGGFACFANQEDGDWLTATLNDDDDNLGYGAGFEVDSFNDKDMPTDQQGWYFLGSSILELHPIVIDDPSDLPGSLYLHVVGHKANTATSDTLYVNIHWGKRLR